MFPVVRGKNGSANGLAPKVVVGTTMRKLAHLIYRVVKTVKPFSTGIAISRVQLKTASDPRCGVWPTLLRFASRYQITLKL